MNRRIPDRVDYRLSGRIGFVSGTDRNGVNVAINLRRTEVMVEVGGERAYFEDPADLTVLIRALTRARERLVPMDRRRPDPEAP